MWNLFIPIAAGLLTLSTSIFTVLRVLFRRDSARKITIKLDGGEVTFAGLSDEKSKELANRLIDAEEKAKGAQEKAANTRNDQPEDTLGERRPDES